MPKKINIEELMKGWQGKNYHAPDQGFISSATKEINKSEKSLVFTLSDETVDRYQERLIASGAELANYRETKMPHLWCHNRDIIRPPIAKGIWVKFDESSNAIAQKSQYNPKFDFAMQIFEMHVDGYVNCFSVGYLPWEFRPATDEEKALYPRLRWVTPRWEVLESSDVPVPGNPSAHSSKLLELRERLQIGDLRVPLDVCKSFFPDFIIEEITDKHKTYFVFAQKDISKKEELLVPEEKEPEDSDIETEPVDESTEEPTSNSNENEEEESIEEEDQEEEVPEESKEDEDLGEETQEKESEDTEKKTLDARWEVTDNFLIYNLREVGNPVQFDIEANQGIIGIQGESSVYNNPIVNPYPNAISKVLFLRSKWTEQKAKTWIEDHPGIDSNYKSIVEIAGVKCLLGKKTIELSTKIKEKESEDQEERITIEEEQRISLDDVEIENKETETESLEISGEIELNEGEVNELTSKIGAHLSGEIRRQKLGIVD